jgi:nucleotide-binding universal stress UspA family protein
VGWNLPRYFEEELSIREMIKNILFPVDFSFACAAMAPYVRRAADLFRARVTLVHIFDQTGHNGFELYVRPSPDVAEEHQSIAEDKLKAFLQAEFPSGESSRILCFGEPATQIAGIAKTGGFDLVVMPTHANRFRRMLLGSTTAKVLNDADCPVMTSEHTETKNPRPLEHCVWLCAIGVNSDSERVLGLASRTAQEVGASLSVVHAVDRDDDEDARGRLDLLSKTVGSSATVYVVKGPVKEVLLDAVQRLGADALIMGRPQRDGALGRMRDLTYSLVRDSPVPVLSV